jgi:macrolide transport system ATP-binding/permease protein
VTILAAVFAALALLLTCVGLYGLMAYLVQRRTAEIGVRVALGAARASVISLMMRDTLVQAVAGVVLGLPLAYAATQSIGMHGIPPASGTALAAGTVLLVICLALAGYVPARRASRLDPNVVLRAE